MNLRLDNPTKPGKRIIPHPKPPMTLKETGLDPEWMADLLIKTIYRQNLQLPSEMSKATKLPIPLIDKLIQILSEKRLIEVKGQLGASLTAEMRYQLPSAGKAWALEALAQSEYIGPAPVPVDMFTAQVRKQSIRSEVLTREALERQFSHLTMPDWMTEQIGPAVNSGQSILLYGPPGNGKSSIAEAVAAAYEDYIFIPHALEVDGQVITLYDPTVHRLMVEDNRDPGSIRHERAFDERFIRTRRPVIITGGELNLDMLDLSYSPISKIYEAPIQLKACGGVFVIDDFGRQRESPQALVNRMIIPLEANKDFLSLQTGRKFQIIFDALVVFSTNINPKELVDGAALRRLRYKILVDSPDIETFVDIFHRAAKRAGLELTEEILSFVMFELYEKEEGAKVQAFHPRFLIDQILAICTYEGTKPALREDYLRRAWGNLYTKH
ncbi:ATPase [Paralimibaculum aggregatum]|uniref:ATPase n=1 Tax=Paralimibaculum aggregatum TaxID=3036245 RepID=A0ABQ6LDB1_9RHOB|nr:AAA family ATPase [Limibaculum sp. NKW23]GMG81347.1 ATPase [Limibaculum sp. NKW23]